MRDDQLQLFHSKTSVLLNLGRLLAADLIRDVASAADRGLAPLASAEGFIRQLLGWREFMRHLHEQTDGYRLLASTVPQEPRKVPQEASPDQTPGRRPRLCRPITGPVCRGDPIRSGSGAPPARRLLGGKVWPALHGHRRLAGRGGGLVPSHHPP